MTPVDDDPGRVAQDPAIQPPPRLVYIMGAGRSGSTVLGILLGNIQGVFYAGELMAWNHFGGVPITERPDVERFWSGVGEAVAGRAEHHRTDFFPLLEHHRALARPHRFFDPVLRTRYERQNRELLAAIASRSDCHTIVDSSHFPTRAWMLSRLPYLDVHVIHLVRDPVDVIAALRTPVQRRRPMGVVQANLYCLGVAALSRIVLAGLPRARRTIVRYEDLICDPRGVLISLGDFLDVDVSDVDPTDLVVGPVFQGNRVRHEEWLSIRPPTARKASRQSALTAVLQAPLRLAYGHVGVRRPRRGTPPPGDTASPASEQPEARVLVP